MKKCVLFVVLFILVATYAMAIDCPSCGMRMMWTGETKTDWGKMLKLYRCIAGHSYWFTTEQERQDREQKNSGSYSNQNDDNGNSGESTLSNEVICPLCGSRMMWTGKTKIEWGKMLKIYRCPAGHEAVGK